MVLYTVYTYLSLINQEHIAIYSLEIIDAESTFMYGWIIQYLAWILLLGLGLGLWVEFWHCVGSLVACVGKRTL